MWTGEWKPFLDGVCERFNASQDEYEVIPLSIPADGADTKFLLAVSGGDPPDVVCQWDPVLGLWSQHGLVTPLDELMTPQQKADFLRTSYPIVRKSAMYEGKIYAMVAGVDVSAVYYRLDHLKEVGLDEHSLPSTLEDLVALGAKLDRRDAAGNLRRVGFLPQNFETFAPAFGGGLISGDRIVVDTAPNRRALGFIVERAKKLGFDQITRFTSSLAADESTNAPLIAGNYSIMMDGEWRIIQAAKYGPNIPYVVAPLPPPKGGVRNAGYTNANLMMIPRGAKHARGAWAFMRFAVGLDRPDQAARFATEMGWLPFSPAVADSPDFRAFVKKYPQFKTFLGLMTSENLQVAPQGPLQAYAMDADVKANESANRGSLGAAAALAKAQATIDHELMWQRSVGHIQ